jgi:hypothetical protein
MKMKKDNIMKNEKIAPMITFYVTKIESKDNSKNKII